MSILAGVSVAGAARQESSNVRPTYEDAIRSFVRSRSFADAQRDLGAWRREDVEAAISVLVRRGDPALQEAAALFHLELAIVVAPQSPDGASQHLTLGARLLEGAPAAAFRASGLAATWYSAAASIFLAQTDAVRARAVLARAPDPLRSTARVRLVEGMIEELQAQRFDVDVARDEPSRVAIHLERRAILALAEGAYRAALTIDPQLVHARIRLGRVLFLVDRVDEARPVLAQARGSAVSRSARYLSRLFLAPVLERTGDVDGARIALEEARQIAPQAQSAWIALAELEERHGRPVRARDIVQSALARDPSAPRDDWWDYRSGALDTEGLAWLRARVYR